MAHYYALLHSTQDLHNWNIRSVLKSTPYIQAYSDVLLIQDIFYYNRMAPLLLSVDGYNNVMKTCQILGEISPYWRALCQSATILGFIKSLSLIP